jgi:hypothetical protein
MNLITLGAAARRIGHSYRHTRRLVQRGELKATPIRTSKRGPEWRTTPQACAAYLRKVRA